MIIDKMIITKQPKPRRGDIIIDEMIITNQPNPEGVI
jgi:hypothetical protein